jgi:hypothetical protein
MLFSINKKISKRVSFTCHGHSVSSLFRWLEPLWNAGFPKHMSMKYKSAYELKFYSNLKHRKKYKTCVWMKQCKITGIYHREGRKHEVRPHAYVPVKSVKETIPKVIDTKSEGLFCFSELNFYNIVLNIWILIISIK